MSIMLKIFCGNFFLSCDLDIFDGSIGYATKFHAGEIFFFFLSLLDQNFAKVEHTICDFFREDDLVTCKNQQKQNKTTIT